MKHPMTDASNPYNTLLALFRRFDEGVKDFPAKKNATPTKLMVCFSLLGVNMIVALEEIVELLELPTTTQLPRVKPWVKGIANLHGRLLPVVNFAEFLGSHAQTPPRQQRVVVLEMHNIFIGLMVDKVYGMRHFQLDAYSQEVPEAPEVLAPYIEGGFDHEGAQWLLFRPSELIRDRSFLEVAA